jgi:hypothetical protein
MIACSNDEQHVLCFFAGECVGPMVFNGSVWPLLIFSLADVYDGLMRIPP